MLMLPGPVKLTLPFISKYTGSPSMSLKRWLWARASPRLVISASQRSARPSSLSGPSHEARKPSLPEQESTSSRLPLMVLSAFQYTAIVSIVSLAVPAVVVLAGSDVASLVPEALDGRDTVVAGCGGFQAAVRVGGVHPSGALLTRTVQVARSVCGHLDLVAPYGRAAFVGRGSPVQLDAPGALGLVRSRFVGASGTRAVPQHIGVVVRAGRGEIGKRFAFDMPVMFLSRGE